MAINIRIYPFGLPIMSHSDEVQGEEDTGERLFGIFNFVSGPLTFPEEEGDLSLRNQTMGRLRAKGEGNSKNTLTRTMVSRSGQLSLS